ncbi:hypothetical protein D6C89_04056 [Aureobasidium pullulans]|nr:hypothetical protein D6D03_00135 [Aureobasidium pullulans]THZ25960.1 hypothetical protein D6C89_04056 [Aureobasidium pullulans]TIA49485.1 hypothetical protein D6C79_03565 [Aureobasidium pullulans]
MANATTSGDLQLAAAAAGFSLGFGWLTVVRAYKQTRANRAPARSTYIYMLWGEILSNLVLGILTWLYLKDVVKTTPVLLFFILVFYALEVQLLMQIIINRIAVIAERRPTATKLKIVTAVLISCVNIVVFCIFIPSHLMPPVNQTYVHINRYWDRLSKVLIMLVDAFLNWYFVYVVRARLVKYHGLRKYKPLVAYYTRLGLVSVAMDVMLIGLMSLRNHTLFVQFHPVAYMVKLNIEMSMADMIVKVARTSENDVRPKSSSQTPFPERSYHQHTLHGDDGMNIGPKNTAVIGHSQLDHIQREDIKGINRQTEVQVYVGDSDSDFRTDSIEQGKDQNKSDRNSYESQVPLKDLNRPTNEQ